MNFFEHQERARRQSRRLVLLLLLAVAALIWIIDVAAVAALAHANEIPVKELFWFGLPRQRLWEEFTPQLIVISAVVFGFITLASLYKVSQLRAGGVAVAYQMNATAIGEESTDLLHQRLRNVVEEIAIASGMPMPRLFVLEDENAINAFVAGYTATDAVMVVTRGALERLNREELQGVIGHEFSHIANGDMRLNIRLMGVIFGLLALSVIGRVLLRSVRFSGRRRRGRVDGRGVLAVLAAGSLLYLVGLLGVLLGRLIRASVSRKRELLADASAVQFTRNTSGIANALKAIARTMDRSYLHNPRTEEISHMLFASGQRFLAGLLATHPPLELRIKTLDPSFNVEKYRASQPAHPLVAENLLALQAQGQLSENFDLGAAKQALVETQIKVIPAEVTAALNAVGPDHLVYAQGIRASIPPRLYAAAHTDALSLPLVLALLLNHDERIRKAQLSLIEQQLGVPASQQVAELFTDLHGAGVALCLPLLDMVTSAMNRKPAIQLRHLQQLADKLIECDGIIDPMELMLSAVLRTHLRDVLDPSLEAKSRREKSVSTQEAVTIVLGAVASFGHSTKAQAEQAFAQGWRHLYGGHVKIVGEYEEVHWSNPTALLRWYQALEYLDQLKPSAKQRLLQAVLTVIQTDGCMTRTEGELVRCIGACLHLPLAPFVAKAIEQSN